MNVLLSGILLWTSLTINGFYNNPGVDQETREVKSMTASNSNHEDKKILKVGVIGLVHTHVHWILGREDYGDIEIVGIVEPNKDLAKRYSEQHGFSMDIVYDTMEEMIARRQPEAVTAFNTIYDHLEVVKFCGPRGIHVMVEKPLAVSLDHARQMAKLAKEHDIHLLTNYETTWYDSHEKAMTLIADKRIGEIRKMVFNTGHPGPIEIGCNSEFLEWLTDPVLNGGGALTDFGCYGANLASWFLQGAVPETITCVTQQFKPELYPKVEDEATILITYPGTQVIIQASWNWTDNRKESEIYGQKGFIICKNNQDVQIRENEGVRNLKIASLNLDVKDPFATLQKVVHENQQLESYDPSLENNMMVMRILEAAKISSQEKRTVNWNEVSD